MAAVNGAGMGAERDDVAGEPGEAGVATIWRCKVQSDQGPWIIGIKHSPRALILPALVGIFNGLHCFVYDTCLWCEFINVRACNQVDRGGCGEATTRLRNT